MLPLQLQQLRVRCTRGLLVIQLHQLRVGLSGALQFLRKMKATSLVCRNTLHKLRVRPRTSHMQLRLRGRFGRPTLHPFKLPRS